MAPWLIALIIVAVLCGLGWLTDARARRRRRGLTSLAGSSRPDRVAEADRIVGGTAQQATYQVPGSDAAGRF
ncbi:MAG TPA: hypothetical protein VEO01_26535 [Pseudonocardiaceae bacterium]|nr:hypothetical protein [Pseudonocardiaceae bacterium]